MSIIWTIIIGFAAGVIAKFLYPGNKYEPTGYILTTVLGIIGAFVATYLGQAVGWYQPGEGAGFILTTVLGIVGAFASLKNMPSLGIATDRPHRAGKWHL